MKRNGKSKTLKDFSKKAISLFGTTKITREQAREQGLVFYWPGEPCAKGHLTFRYTKSCDCRTCAIEGNYKRMYPSTTASSAEISVRKSIDNMKYDLEIKKLEKEDYDYDL